MTPRPTRNVWTTPYADQRVVESRDPFPFHRDSRSNKAVVVVFLVLPLVATVYAITSVFLGRGPGLLELSLLAGMWAFTGLGITVGFHRMLTHRAIEARAPTRFLLLVAGTMALQGPPADWAATHTRHHSRSDREGDPHSPQDGFWHAHCLWLLRDRFVRSGIAHERLMADPVTRFVTKTWFIWATLGFVIPTAIASAVTGTVAGAFSGLLWGGLVRVFVGHHVTWSVNSLGHKFGTRPFSTADKSTNNWFISFLGWGEGWHNNHHAFPRAAYIGMRWWQIDMGAWLIVVLRGFGQVKKVVMPGPAERVAKLRRRTPRLTAEAAP